jgi:two-component system sensor histidine kinase ChiS
LERVVNNLFRNALKFTSDRRIVASTKHNSQDVVITVENSGPGIAPEAIAVILEKYQAKGEFVLLRDRGKLPLFLALS